MAHPNAKLGKQPHSTLSPSTSPRVLCHDWASRPSPGERFFGTLVPRANPVDGAGFLADRHLAAELAGGAHYALDLLHRGLARAVRAAAACLRRRSNRVSRCPSYFRSTPSDRRFRTRSALRSWANIGHPQRLNRDRMTRTVALDGRRRGQCHLARDKADTDRVADNHAKRSRRPIES